MTTIKAIETQYKGYRFRSRTEARWAVFFDALGVKWEYEKEGYDLGKAGWYLPDFYLPEVDMYVEIKPETDLPVKDEVKIKTFKKLMGENKVYLLQGPPVTFQDDDRENRFESHVSQMLFCARVSIALDPKVGEDGEARGKFPLSAYRAASNAARSARFEHGENVESRLDKVESALNFLASTPELDNSFVVIRGKRWEICS